MDNCPAEALAQLLGKKWIPQILEHLSHQPLRFGQLQKQLGNSTSKVLKQQLSLLEHHQLIHNEKQHHDNQVISTYSLTTLGLSLVPIVLTMKKWGQEHLECL